MSTQARKIATVIEEMEKIAKSHGSKVVHWDRLEPNVKDKNISSTELSQTLEDLEKINAIKKISDEKFELK